MKTVQAVIINARISSHDLFPFSLAQINSVAFSVTTIKDYMVPDAFAHMILFTHMTGLPSFLYILPSIQGLARISMCLTKIT